MEFIILYHTLFTLQMSRRGILYAYASSNSYKDFKCRYAISDKMYEYYANESFPRFIWVLEIGTLETFSDKKARVEILLDATSSKNSDTWAILSISYKEHMVFVPSVIDRLRTSDSVIDRVLNENKNPDGNVTLDKMETIGEKIKEKVLTEIFKTLYYSRSDFVNDVFDIYSDSNLKEI